MTEPVTANRFLIVPNTGDLPGAWGTSALNPDFSNIDAILGGVTTISLSSATTITLTTLATTGIATTTIPQSNNALIKFTGTQTGNAVIKFTCPGFYIVHNLCLAAGTNYVQLAPATGTGNAIGAPPGKKAQVFFDGTDMDYVSMPEPATAYDLHNATTYPAWMNACTIKPYLIKDGSIYTSASYTALSAQLGSSFGGNGITTFGVPDERARARIGLDTLSVATGTYAGRITSAISGINGTTMGAAGGSESLQTHTHSNTLTDPGHLHTLYSFFSVGSGGASAIGGSGSGQVTGTASTGLTITNASAGSGSSQNMPPSIVSFLPLIKT